MKVPVWDSCALTWYTIKQEREIYINILLIKLSLKRGYPLFQIPSVFAGLILPNTCLLWQKKKDKSFSITNLAKTCLFPGFCHNAGLRIITFANICTWCFVIYTAALKHAPTISLLSDLLPTSSQQTFALTNEIPNSLQVNRPYVCSTWPISNPSD